MERFFGGSPGAVILRLAIISIVVGVVLHALGLDPLNLIESVRALVRYISERGLDALEWLLRYLLIGAIVVVPIWLIVRLVKMVSASSKDRHGES